MSTKFCIINIFCLTLVFLMTTSCENDKEEFIIYTGYWAETLWKLKIYKSDSLFLIPEGHYSNEMSEKLNFRKNKDTLFLNINDEYALPNLKKIVFTDDGLCLVDANNKFYCQDHNWQQKQIDEDLYLKHIEERINELDITKVKFALADSLNQSVIFIQ